MDRNIHLIISGGFDSIVMTYSVLYTYINNKNYEKNESGDIIKRRVFVHHVTSDNLPKIKRDNNAFNKLYEVLENDNEFAKYFVFFKRESSITSDDRLSAPYNVSLPVLFSACMPAFNYGDYVAIGIVADDPMRPMDLYDKMANTFLDIRDSYKQDITIFKKPKKKLIVDFPLKPFHKKEMLYKVWDHFEIPTSLLDITGFCEYSDSIRRDPLCKCGSCKTHYELFGSSDSYRELYDNHKIKTENVNNLIYVLRNIENNK